VVARHCVARNERLLALRNGHTLLIAQTYHNLARIDERRAQDFLHGVLLTMTHVVATGVMPVVVPA